MPEAIYVEPETLNALAIFVRHLLERLDTLNTILAEIADRLDGMEKRLSYATVLDNSD